MMKKINLPLTKNDVKNLKAGDCVTLSGTIYTARDCAHKRLVDLLNANKPLPFDLQNAVIYYAGPCPAKPKKISGSCGPTTSARMDAYAPTILRNGAIALIGKGEMSDEVKHALIEQVAVYFSAIGGAGAIYGNAVKSSTLVAFPDLLSEAIYKLEVKDYPLVVAMDCHGNCIY